jgi:hypothetical protein
MSRMTSSLRITTGHTLTLGMIFTSVFQIVIRKGVFVTTTHVPSDIYSAIGDNALSFIVFLPFSFIKPLSFSLQLIC